MLSLCGITYANMETLDGVLRPLLCRINKMFNLIGVYELQREKGRIRVRGIKYWHRGMILVACPSMVQFTVLLIVIQC